MLVTVYSPDGEMFENVSSWRAERLVVFDGWSYTRSSKVESSYKKPAETVEVVDEYISDDDENGDEDSVFDDAQVD